MKKLACVVSALSVASLLADPADPQVSNVVVVQNPMTRQVKVTYHLDEPAIMTMDVLTNGVSIGGSNIDNVTGDCFKQVAAGDHSLRWAPEMSWPDQRFDTPVVSVRMVAWATNCPPDYLVVDLTSTGGVGTERWYASESTLPGGLLSNKAYRTTHLVLRKIRAKNVTWTMGSVFESGRHSDETAHTVMLDHNYYIGVFPVTQSQWALLPVASGREAPSRFSLEGCRAMRPVEQVDYNEIRTSDSQTANPNYFWPADPHPDSFLGLLRKKTGLSFDLPSEAEWEFACRAGTGEGFWNNGKPYTSKTADDNLPGRYSKNGGQIDGKNPVFATCTEEHGTAYVGSYEPNAWGLYDMHGNVYEWCLDWYEASIVDNNGAVNVDREHPEKTLSGATGSDRVARGGSWVYDAFGCRSAYRDHVTPNTRHVSRGLRLALIAGE